jgi:integrase
MFWVHMRKAITKTAVDAMKPGDLIADTKVQGFVVRCLPSGKVTYGFRYRLKNAGTRRWIALGLHGQITPDEARTIAQKHAGAVADRRDPLAEQVTARAKAKGAQTIGDILDAFIADYARPKKLRSTNDTESLFDRLVKPRIGGLAVHDLRKSHLVEMLDAIAKETGPTLADRMLAHTRRALNWYEATSADDSFRVPVVRGMAKTFPRERARQRALTADELREIDAALPSVNPVFAGIVRTLMYSAQRRDEIARMQWAEIDGDTLVVPAARYKTKRDNLVPLTPRLKELIESQPRRAKCPYVFSTNGKTPFSGFSKCKRTLDAAINVARKARGIKDPIPNWRLHDLRRTARTLMSGAGVSSDIAERVLGHAMEVIRRTYDVHAYEPEKRDTLERLGAAIERILNPPTGNVVQIGKAKTARN